MSKEGTRFMMLNLLTMNKLSHMLCHSCFQNYQGDCKVCLKCTSSIKCRSRKCGAHLLYHHRDLSFILHYPNMYLCNRGNDILNRFFHLIIVCFNSIRTPPFLTHCSHNGEKIFKFNELFINLFIFNTLTNWYLIICYEK